RYRRDRALDIALGRLPVGNGNAHAALAAPRHATEERLTHIEYLLDDAIGVRVMILRRGVGAFGAEAHESLIDHRLPDHFGTAERTDLFDERRRVAAAAVDQIGNATATELANRC